MIQLHFSDNTREKIELLVKIAKSLDFQHIKTEYIAEEERDYKLSLLHLEEEVKEGALKITNFINSMPKFGYITTEEEIHQQRIMILTFLDVCDFIEKYIKRKTIKNL